MSYKLVFNFDESRLKPELEQTIREKFQTEFGVVTTIPVTVQLLKADGRWTTVEAFFDTGAVISLFSKQVGEEIGITRFVPHRLSGISKREECMLAVRLAKARARLVDIMGNTSPELDIWVAFAEEPVPHVLGMKDIINKFRLESDPVEKKFYLTWKE